MHERRKWSGVQIRLGLRTNVDYVRNGTFMQETTIWDCPILVGPQTGLRKYGVLVWPTLVGLKKPQAPPNPGLSVWVVTFRGKPNHYLERDGKRVGEIFGYSTDESSVRHEGTFPFTVLGMWNMNSMGDMCSIYQSSTRLTQTSFTIVDFLSITRHNQTAGKIPLQSPTGSCRFRSPAALISGRPLVFSKALSSTSPM